MRFSDPAVYRPMEVDMTRKSPANKDELMRLLKKGEGSTVEFKRSNAELREGMQAVCGFLNGSGGVVVFGVRPDGVPEGQQTSDKTLREIAQAFERFEPPVNIPVERLPLESGRDILMLRVEGNSDSIPFTYEGRPFERVGSTTRRMSQQSYENLLLERTHSKRRWENQPADEIGLRDIDQEEVFRIVEIARSVGRLVGPVGRRLPDALDRLGLRKNGRILRAAVVLFGKTFLPDYPQCELRMARFRGTDKTEFLDQRQIRGPAFKLLEEAELFCQRHFPLPAKIVPSQMRRVETPLIPPDAMREILVNALIHRDYSIAGGAVSLALFDDRVEVWSAGSFPGGITPASLRQNHLSVQRNPIIADAFYRTGLIERWGRGTNRVIATCHDAGIPAPEFEEITGAAVVTFRVDVAGAAPRAQQVTGQVTAQVTGQVTAQVARILKAAKTPKTRGELQDAAGISHREHFRTAYLQPLLSAGWLERTIPDKPRSRMQRYRTTEAGHDAIKRNER